MELAIDLLTRYGYVILLPLAVVEGPIVTVIGGFLVTLGVFNPLPVYLIVLAGDAVGDTLAYSVGRWGSGFAARILGRWFRVTAEGLEQAKEYFLARENRALITSKLVHGVGVTGLVAAGSLRVPYPRFMRTCIAVACFQAAFFLGVGVAAGSAYARIGMYLDRFAALTLVAGALVVLGIALARFFTPKA